MDPATATGLVAAEQVISTTVQGGAVAAYGLAQPTQPLAATFTRITSEAFLPRFNHSITAVNGQAYIFGGEIEEEGEVKLAGDEVHIVSLPLKKAGNEGKPDYKCIPSLGEGTDGKTPGPRSGHTARAIGERIYLFGGKAHDESPIEEMGRVWVFDTNTLGWSHVDPASEAHIPPGRYLHGCATSEHPLPQKNPSENTSYTSQITSGIAKLPSLVAGKGGNIQEPHGSLIICGGLTSPREALNDTYIFNVLTRTWSPLPLFPTSTETGESPCPPSFALANNRLYLLTHSSDLSSTIHTLPLTRSTTPDARGSTELGLSTSATEWSKVTFPTNPLTPGPRPRKGAGLANITTGNGREYLIYFMGEKTGGTVNKGEEKAEELARGAGEPVYLADFWSYQIPASSPVSAAGIKDKTRNVLGYSSGEGSWAEVGVVARTEEEQLSPAGGGDGRGGDTSVQGKAHPGPRGWFAWDGIPRSVQGNGIVVWGGRNGAKVPGQEADPWVVQFGSA